MALALLGLAALVLNFAGAVMYLLQERQLKAKRPGAFYYRLPPLETLDRLTYRALTLGFPFLTAGLLLGVLWAGATSGRPLAFDPLTLLSVVMWIVYALTLSGRAVGDLARAARRVLRHHRVLRAAPEPRRERGLSRAPCGCEAGRMRSDRSSSPA